MRFQILIFSTILIFSILLTACTGGEQPKVNTTNGQTSVNNPNKNTSALQPTTPTPEATTNEAPTVKPVFLAYCDAWTKKDEAALRKVYSQATLKFFEADMKAEKETSLFKHLDGDKVSNKLCEIRNEKVEGDVAVAEAKTEGAPNGYKVKFVKENGEWKLTNEFPDFKAVEGPAKSANTAK